MNLFGGSPRVQPFYGVRCLMAFAVCDPRSTRETIGPTGLTLDERFLLPVINAYPKEMKTTQEAPRRTRKYDASNFDDYLVVGLIAFVIVALFAALILL